MSEIKEIILFCYGDSSLASTWSNVPYLMSKNFIDKGIIINRIDLNLPWLLRNAFNAIVKFVLIPLGIVNKNYRFMRTPLCRFLTERKVKKAVKKYHNADWCVFLNFDYTNRYSSIPSLLFSDWTYQMQVESRTDSKPTKYDEAFYKWQYETINAANIAIPMFDDSYESMLSLYPDANIKKISRNVINSCYDGSLDEDDIIAKKMHSDYIIFIGRKEYLHGLSKLIEAMKAMDSSMKLHVIGLTRDKMPDAPEWVCFHGFLKKDNPKQCELYYNLLLGAKMLVNPQDRWGAYFSLVESMFFYNPVIVNKNFEQIQLEFGSNIDFGEFCYNYNKENLALSIRTILNASPEKYKQMCLNAHNHVKDYTWSNYCDDMLDIMAAYNNRI